jgi:hypothetical protein
LEFLQKSQTSHSDAYVNHNGGYYKAGEATEFVLELGITGGSSALKRAVVNKGGSAVIRKEADAYLAKRGMDAIKDYARHHKNTLVGHPMVKGFKGFKGGIPAMFPTGGLPAFIHSGAMNTQYVRKAAHYPMNVRQAKLERGLGKFLNPWAKGAANMGRANLGRDCL